MARKKRVGKTKHHRRRKMGAIKQDGSIEAFFGAILGYVAAYMGEAQIQSLSANALAAIQVALGGSLAYFPKNWFVKGIGVGIGINGAATGLESFGLLSGIGAVYDPSRGVGAPKDVVRVGFPKAVAVGNGANSGLSKNVYYAGSNN